jgi:hypothetical protein
MTERNPSTQPSIASGLQCRLPLIIGVTGHRDLRSEDIEALERNVRDVFSRLARDYLGADGATPIVVMSSLAEGADQLVARVALESGAALVAPLPMPAAEYRQDFKNGAAPGTECEFDRLLGLAISAPEMPLVEGNTPDNIRTDAARRALQYREAGVFIIRHCHILLSLWDGDDGGLKTGGTAEIVHLKKEGFSLRSSRFVRDCIDGTEIGPVITIATPRRNAPGATIEVATRAWGRELTTGVRARPEFERDARIWRDFETSIGLTTSFNRDAARVLSSPDGKEKFKRSLVQLLDTPASPETTTRARGLGFHDAPLWCATYAIADVLAQENQKRFRSIWTWLFTFAFLMAASLALPSSFPAIKKYAFGFYQSLFACSFILYFFARRRQYQAKYLDYRALSETTRVGIFWKIARIDKPVMDVYPICQSLELAWVRVSLKSLACFDYSGSRPTAPLDALRYKICHDVWISSQFEYFKNRSLRHGETATRSRNLSVAFLVISGVGTLLIGLSGALGFDWRRYAPFDSATLVLLFLELLPAAGAAIQGHAEQLGRTAQALQFERMRTLFERALAVLPESLEACDEEAAREVLIELGREAVHEAASWTSIFRLRPLRPI